MDFIVGIISRNLANMSNFVEFRDNRNLHVFEAPSIGCCKTKCDVTKVTYNMYSCDTCCMDRERMEIDGRDSAKCRKSKFRDMDGIFEFKMIIGQTIE